MPSTARRCWISSRGFDTVDVPPGWRPGGLRAYIAAMAKDSDNKNYKVIAENRRARFDYAIEEDLEVGIVLTGSEVKSLRENTSNIAESYAAVEGGELWLVNGYIAPYAQAKTWGHEERRRRKLLASKRELSRDLWGERDPAAGHDAGVRWSCISTTRAW